MICRRSDRRNIRPVIMGVLVYMAGLVLMVATGHAQPTVVDVEATRDHLFAGTTDLANFGESVVVADFNGDEIDDVAMSSPRDQTPRGVIQTGLVSIFYGGMGFAGLTDIVRIGKDNQADVEIYGAPDDRIGQHMTAGDLNGDGFDDLVVTAQDHPGDGARLDFENEKIYIFFGSAALSSLIQIPSGVGVTLERNFSHITALAAGDMNGDGMDDLVVADDLSDDPMFPPTPATSNRGANGDPFNGGAYAFFGRAMWPMMLNLATEHDLFIGRDNGVGVFQPQSLAFGNLNNDVLPPPAPVSAQQMGHPLEDLIIGASRENVVIPGLTLDEAGQVFVLYGREMFSGPIEVDMNMDVKIQGVFVDDQIGDAVTTGDVNGDGFDDVLIGAPESGLGVVSTSGVGKAHLVLGKANLPAVVDLFTMSDSLFIYSENAREIDTRTGEALAIADLDNDGFGDMMIAAPSDPPGAFNSGAVYVIKGRAMPDAEYQIDVQADIRYEAPLPPAMLSSGRLGSSLGVGDFDADGILDLFMSAPQGNVPSAGLPPMQTDLAGSGWAAFYFKPVPPPPTP